MKKKSPLISYEMALVFIISISISLFYNIDTIFSALNDEQITSIQFSILYMVISTDYHTYRLINNAAIIAILTIAVNLARPAFETIKLAIHKWRNIEK